MKNGSEGKIENEPVGKTETEKLTEETTMSEVAEQEEVTNKTATSVVAGYAEKTHGAEAEVEEMFRTRIASNRAAVRNAIKPSNQPGLADPLIGPSTANMNPGAIHTSAIVKFHSTQSVNLFRGRKGDPKNNVRPIIGLARFARQVALVWSASSIDDPFADQVLLDIEEAYEAAKEILDTREKTMNDLLHGMEDFEITIGASDAPVEFRLQFYSPWGFRGAMLLKQFDKIMRMALTAKHIGLFADNDWISIVNNSARALRHMFAQVDGWISTGLKREDIRQKNKLAKRAITKYDEAQGRRIILTAEVMSGLYRAKLSPVNRVLEAYLSDLSQGSKIVTEIKIAAESLATKANEVKQKTVDGKKGN